MEDRKVTKHHGLSRLAEATGGEPHYPVRRRGEKRRLNPNWTAIAWLEADALEATEIEYIDEPDLDGLVGLRAFGWYRAKDSGTNYCRPMIQIIHNEHSSGRPAPVRPCTDCDNWAYTSRCTEHHDNTINGLSLGYERRQRSTLFAHQNPWRETIREHCLSLSDATIIINL